MPNGWKAHISLHSLYVSPIIMAFYGLVTACSLLILYTDANAERSPGGTASSIMISNEENSDNDVQA